MSSHPVPPPARVSAGTVLRRTTEGALAALQERTGSPAEQRCLLLVNGFTPLGPLLALTGDEAGELVLAAERLLAQGLLAVMPADDDAAPADAHWALPATATAALPSLSGA